jgi:hypothetical protein
MSSQSPKQLLHLVFGGELTDLDSVEFSDLSKLDIVGIYPNYAVWFTSKVPVCSLELWKPIVGYAA